MKLRTKEEVITTLKDLMPLGGGGDLVSTPWGTSFLDHRDINRLSLYLAHDEAAGIFIFNDVLKAGDSGWHDVIRPWNEETVKKHIESSLEFAFRKALDQRSISSSLMHGVMRMWMWTIRDEKLAEGEPDYSDYGLAYLYKIRDEYFPEMRPQGR